MEEHSFTSDIRAVLNNHFGYNADTIFSQSLLIQYINHKTKSANRNSKSRSSFANLYAIYVLVEDYIENGFISSGEYNKYEGAQFINLLNRQRELPFGSKLQNHGLNNRMNAEFEKFFQTSNITPILRNLETNRYWINERLLIVQAQGKQLNIADAIIEVIDKYIEVKQDSFKQFIKDCKTLKSINQDQSEQIYDFILKLLDKNSDARLFEIVSYSILKFFYEDFKIIWGYDRKDLRTEELKLYKTGRTNANDGGIDFVMRPLGRFFQVTETLDFKKYFLDIGKVNKYPITFVIKSDDPTNDLEDKLRYNASKAYGIDSIVEDYMKCIEELINIPKLISCFEIIKSKGLIPNVLNEIIIQSNWEFNYEEEEEEEENLF